jgi:hypothetical protein
MPTYRVQLGDGRTVRVEAANPEAADRAAGEFLRAKPLPGARGQAGYVRARQKQGKTEERLAASPRLPGSDFQRRAIGSLGVSDEIGGAFAGAGQGAENLFRRMAGKPIEITAEQAALAAMDTEREWQGRYARENPTKNFFASGLGIAAGGAPARGVAAITAPLRAGGAVALANAPFALGRQEGNLAERAPGAAVETALAFGTGAAFTAGGNALARRGAAARVAPPSNARRLSREGVTLTPGQMMGGTAQRIEDAMTSVPVVGDAIREAKIRGVDSFDRAAINRTIAPVGAQLAPNATMGRGAVAAADQEISDAYTRALGGVQIAPDAQYANDLAQVAQTANLTGAQREQLNVVLGDIQTRFGGQVPGDLWKVIDSDIGKAIRAADNASQNAPGGRALIEALQSLKQAHVGLLARTAPQARAGVQAADEATANLARVRQASQYAGTSARGGTFSPADLNRAVLSGDSSAGNRAFARGDALMQDLTDPAMAVLPATVPDSGTPFRAMAMAGGPAAVFGQLGWATPEQMIIGLGSLGVGAAAYSRPVQAAINALYRAKSPGQVREVLGALGQEAARNPQLAPVYEEIVRALGAPLPASSGRPSPQGRQPEPMTP